ncbi:E3 ubiquitin-protein ligase RLIM-like, partial [Sigmodon hispidus]
GAKASDVVSTGDSERGHFTSFQQSEKKTKSKKVEFRAWTTNNDDISGGMGFTFNNENSNLLNDHALLSGLSCHDSNRDEQKQVDHQQLESTCVFPFLTEENVPENLIEDPFTSDRNIRSESLEFVIADEITESRPPQPIQHLSPETFSHLTMPDPLSSVRPVLPLRDDFNISEFQRRYFSTTSPTRKHTEHTAHVDQSTFVRATNIFPVQINTKEHTDISLHSNWENVQNSEIISVAQTSNTDLNFTVATASDETSKQIMTEIFEGERVNSIEIDLEACDSSSSQNSRRVYSEDCSIPRSVSNSVSHSTSNVSTNHSCISSSRSSQQSLPIPNFMDNTIIMNRFLPVLFQISDDSNEPILLVDDPSTALQETRVTNQEYNDSDSWPSLPDFSNFNDIHNNHPKGLTKEQIKTLPTRNFCENDELNACSICITEYIESSKIRILPCSHEYHVECIDHWLYENASCPICRCKIINPDDREIFF